jgi:hypothetical protein
MDNPILSSRQGKQLGLRSVLSTADEEVEKSLIQLQSKKEKKDEKG